MDREFSIFLDSGHCQDIYPSNAAQNFTIHLPRSVHLKGEWECALVQFVMEGRSEAGFYVCCDILTESHVGDFMLPVLRRVRDKMWQFKIPLYVPVKTHSFNSIHIYLRNWHNVEPGRMKDQTHCVLHFRRVS